MAVYLSKTMKRKDIDYNSDDFSLFSPASKIRRLDAGHPLIIEDELGFPSWIKTPAAIVGVDNLASNISRAGSLSQVMVEMSATSENVDRSIVLSNPVTTPLPLSPSRFSIDSDILSGIKKDIHRSNLSSFVKSAEDQEEIGRKNTRRSECLAVVPWNPPLQQFPFTTSGNMQGVAMSELVEDDQLMGEATTMDIEEYNTATEYYSQQMNENLPQWQPYSQMNENLLQWQQQQQQQYSQMNENLLQWQQQQQQQYSQMNENLLQWQLQQQQQHHCMMIQQAPQSASAPLMQYQWW